MPGTTVASLQKGLTTRPRLLLAWRSDLVAHHTLGRQALIGLILIAFQPGLSGSNTPPY